MPDVPFATLCAIDADPGDRSPSSVDDEVVVRARGGDRQALERLLRDNYDRVFAVCRRLTGNDADGADAAQEAMIALVRGLPNFDGRSRFTTWAYRVAVNASIDEMRRRGRRPGVSLDELASAASGASAGGVASALVAGSSGGVPEATIDRLDVDAALLQIPVLFRAPVVLRDLCGLDYQEITEVLSLPGGTVRSRIARGRSMLADLLGPSRSEP